MFPKKDDSAESRALHEHDHDHDHSDVEDQGNISFQKFHFVTIGLGITRVVQHSQLGVPKLTQSTIL